MALQRVLTNLLDNALRHAAHARRAARSRGRVEVADDGPGFAAEDLPHVFEPLFRGDRARAAAAAPASAWRSPAGWRARTAATSGGQRPRRRRPRDRDAARRPVPDRPGYAGARVGVGGAVWHMI